jgi:hypothetical protein
MKMPIAFTILLLAAGCLECETFDARILREQGEPSILTAEFGNIASDKTDPAGVQSDFDELIGLWRGDEMLKDQLSEGILVKSRELFLRDGQLIGRETGIINDLTAIDEFSVSESDISWTLDANEELLETNGKVLKTQGSVTIVWPKNAPELYVRIRTTPSGGNRASQPMMAKLLQAYLARAK